MGKYDNLLQYISYFQESKEFCTWEASNEKPDSIPWGYPEYDDKLTQFIDDFYKTDLLKQDYLEFLDKNVARFENIEDVIGKADFETLKAILTYYVRQERFSDGLWATAAEEGIFLKLLEKLCQFDK
ncbi:hypothetical protein SPSYN_02106 [Sporotomaculum syntrophicum]|uniref:Uncharacterized protein n=1 Tax=Sporotomaculum syntrophicum TaxID=182264 RepID=A0A9D2WMV5_9FIRM|nr:DUF6508 domain-containing protein [Sporotomaculum syntrophicum]KAF1084330.1 hypothetical protein SPSYN_02106 [Sporotomaculum syntrophicum]